MNPLAIRARNYRTFEELDLELPTGCVAFVGPNGAGKSSVVNVIDLALFGPEGRSLEEYLTDDGGEELDLELVFSHRGQTYRVKRAYSARGKSWLALDVASGAEPHEWWPVAGQTQRDAQEQLEQILGLTRETFRASSFLAQGQGANFAEAVPRERKRILGEILGLGIWDRVRELVRRDLRELDLTLARTERDLERSAEQAARIPELVSLHCNLTHQAEREAVALALLEGALADLRRVERESVQANANRRALEAELAAAAQRVGQLAGVIGRADVAEAQLAALRDEIVWLSASADGRGTLEAERDALAAERERWMEESHALDALVHEAAKRAQDRRDLEQQAQVAAQRAGEVGRKAITIREAESVCDRCGQLLRGEAVLRAVASLEAEARALDEEAEDLFEQAEQLDPGPEGARLSDVQLGQVERRRLELREPPSPSTLDAQITEARAAEARLADVRAEIAGCVRESDAATPEVRRELEQAKDAALVLRAGLDAVPPPREGEVARELADTAQSCELARQAVVATQVAIARIDEQLADAHRHAEALERGRAEHSSLHREAQVLAELDRACGPDGIPALVLENAAVPAIEIEASRILAELGTAFRVELRTQRALKSGEGLRDTLDVVVIREGLARGYETFSGGERTRINLALRIALARLLAHRRGAESRVLVIDEPEFLDEAGVAALVHVLRGLTGDFEAIYLVSHVAGLRDGFDRVIEVVKENGRSRVVA